MAALGALGRMRSKSPAVNAVARELALGLALAMFQIGIHEHVAGKDNILPDYLSRLKEPGAAQQPPCSLTGVHRTRVATRDKGWWKT